MNVEHFIKVYTELNRDNLDLVTSIYHPDIEFQDPAHKLNGLSALLGYFRELYSNVSSCQFNIFNVDIVEDKAYLMWEMTYSHPKLNHKKPITVQGASLIRFKDGLVIYHRDFLDLGAMLYEHIPLVGNVIKALKRRMAS
ncbi:nuclear transport factor 2 family protein [Vibrio sp.]|nr:nuclear transport factor 2 family protein [Vibrio sp.]